jgi:hypothetical protein
VDMRGADELTVAIGRAGRRVALGLAAATALAGTAITASAARPVPWVTPALGGVSAVLTGWLLRDLARHR